MSNTATNLPEKLDKREPMLLTNSELNYQTLRASGMPAYKAFEKAFSNDPDWQDFFKNLPKKANLAKAEIRWAARELDRRPEMKMLRSKVNEKLADMSSLALDTLEELMVEGKSEKVRGDVAIEILRQNVGSPDKNGDNNVNIKVVFGNDPSEIVEGEVVDDDRY